MRRTLGTTVLFLGLLAAGCATTAGTTTGTIDAVDEDARTISVAGRTVYVPEPIRVDNIEIGSRYTVYYERQDGQYVANSIDMVGTGNQGDHHSH